MKDNQTIAAESEALCLHQKEIITRQEVQIWDLEEEIRVLNRQIRDLQDQADKQLEKIDKFELWCDHQQALINAKDIERINLVKELEYYRDLAERRGFRNNIVFRAFRKLKRLFSK